LDGKGRHFHLAMVSFNCQGDKQPGSLTNIKISLKTLGKVKKKYSHIFMHIPLTVALPSHGGNNQTNARPLNVDV